MAIKPTPEIAYDGIGLSMKTLGKTKEAIKILEEKKQTTKSDRLIACLGHLYLYEQDQSKARKQFLSLIDTSPIWSAWLSRALKMKKLTQDRKFISKATKIITTKKEYFPALEKTLLQHAKTFKIPHTQSLVIRLQKYKQNTNG